MSSEEDRCELELGEPPEDIKEWARININETPETRVQLLEELRDMIFEKGDVEPHRTDDGFLLRFLRARSFNVDNAYKLLVRYFNFKEDNPVYHKNVRPLGLKFIGEYDIISVPPYKEQTGRRLMIYRIGNWDPNMVNVDDLFKATITILELGILEQQAQILGGIAIFDFNGLALQHAWQVTPTIAAKIIAIMVTSFPMKIHAIHVVNQSKIFDMIFKMFTPLLDDRMKQRVHFHGDDMSSLHNFIDPKHLPLKYGGMRPEHNYNDWLDNLSKNPLVVREVLSLGYILGEDGAKSV